MGVVVTGVGRGVKHVMTSRKSTKKRVRYQRGQDVQVNPDSTMRRLQALAVMGWSARELERRTGRHESGLRRVRSGRAPEVFLSTAKAVGRVFGELENVRNLTKDGKIAATKAMKLGWHHPADWADIEAGDLLDDPDEVVFDHAAVSLAITGEKLPRRTWTDAELDAVVRVLNVEQRMPDEHIATRVRTSGIRVRAARERQGLDPVPREEQAQLKKVA